jgi:uncharacterized RDD family membrane protein YckC
MRCPKCHYISFEDAERCRNCGYDFSLAGAQPQPVNELPLNHRHEDVLPPVDLALAEIEGLSELEAPRGTAGFDLDALEDTRAGGVATPIDLPLFKGSPAPARREPLPTSGRRHGAEPLADDDAPLVKARPVPRPPIAVRRPTPDAQRVRSRYSLAEVPKLALEPPEQVALEQFDSEAEPEPERSQPQPSTSAAPPAPAPRRILAALIDLTILLGINLGVMYFTLKLCELPLTRAGVAALPLLPAGVFLLLLDAGYAITFTAAIGQTIGKMATRLKVVHVSEDDRDEGQPNFAFAILRTAAYAASLLPAGLGFLPALLGKDRRALHDRLAETRVIYWG